MQSSPQEETDVQFAKLNGITLHYRVIGSPAEKPVIVFSNSLGTDFRIWDDVIDLLKSDYAIVTYDKRGHGLSDCAAAPHRIEDHVADLAALLDHLALKNVILCGLSVGGLIAQGLVASRPELVGKLILSDTAHKIGTAEGWNTRIDAIAKNGLASILDPVMERWFTPAFRSPANTAYLIYCNMFTRQPADGYAATCAAIRDADFTRSTAQISLPTLVIVGDQDGSTPPDLVRSTADMIAGSRFEVIAGAGHLPCIEQPRAFVALVRDFLGSH
jgi:3-oxoadipate enol-lactonase